MGQFRNLTLCAAVGMACGSSVSLAQAQAWPAQAVRIIVPYPSGGTSDILARLVGHWRRPRASYGRSRIAESQRC